MSKRIIVLGLVSLLPWPLKRFVLRHFFGYKFSEGARIGFAFVDVRNLEMGRFSKIGSFSIIRNLESLQMGVESRIGTFNWIFGMPGNSKSFKIEESRVSRLCLGDYAAVTSRHILDCIDSIDIGAFSTLAGFRSQLLTHGIDFAQNRQSCAPIRIGTYCFLGSGVILLKGATVPDFCVIAAGSVVNKPLPLPGYIYAGSPINRVRPVDTKQGYFNRASGSVG
jgi:acetyltransferase-like isoleucine patch superfamily enzyme